MSMLTPRGVGARRPSSRRRRHGRHGRHAVLVTLLLAVAVALGAGAWWYADDSREPVVATPRPSCPAPDPTPTALPADQVKVNVYNGTQRKGLAAEVARQLRKRGFRVGTVDNDPLSRKVIGVGEVRRGPAGADAARTVTAHLGQVVAVPDKRSDASVDVVLGVRFRTLAPTTAAAAALSPPPSPRPAGC